MWTEGLVQLEKVDEVISKALDLVESGKLDDAISLYESFLKLEEVPEVLNNLANLYRMKGFVSKAIELYEKALKISPAFKDAKLNLAAAFLEIGRYGEAMMILENLKNSGYESDELYLALAVAYEKSKRMSDFISAYKKVKRSDKDDILRSYGVEPPR